MSATGRAALLERFLAPHLDEPRVMVRGRATGGLSQETWFVDVAASDGPTTSAVLRLPTAASGSRSIGVQIRALRLMHDAGVPVPRLLWHDEDADNPFAAPFLVMERLEGDIPTGWNDVDPQTRAAAARDAVDVLVAIQSVPGRAVTASGLPWPELDPAQEELSFYRRRLAALAVPDTGPIEVALRWLASHVPPPEPLVVVHNDYRMGNFVVADGRVAGVLDWEMTRLGHPAADLAWCFIAVWEPVDLEVQELYRYYEQVARRSIDEATLRWYAAMGYLRLAYYALSGGHAFLAGKSQDLRQPLLRLEASVRLDRLFRVIAGDAVI